MSEFFTPLLTGPGSALASAAIILVVTLMTLRSILRGFRSRMEAPSAKEENRRRSTESDPMRVLQRTADELERHYETTMRHHRFVLSTARALAMVGLVILAATVALGSAIGIGALRSLMLVGGLLVEGMALMVAWQGWRYGEQGSMLLNKVISVQYLFVAQANFGELEKDERKAELDRINAHLRTLIDSLHARHRRTGFAEAVGEWIRAKPAEDNEGFEAGPY